MTTTTTLPPLTARQREILAWLAEYIAEHGFSPSTRDICQAFGFGSPNGAMCHLEPLRKKGYVSWRNRQPRTLRITEGAADGL